VTEPIMTDTDQAPGPRPMPPSLANDAHHWRELAEETRAMGESMADAKCKAVMLGIAQGYELQAERAEQRIKAGSR
jgi:hypothetical protein